MIARVVVQRGGTFDASAILYQRTCRDVLGLDRDDSHGSMTPRSHKMMDQELSNASEMVETALQESV
jgi:hypothetical protein